MTAGGPGLPGAGTPTTSLGLDVALLRDWVGRTETVEDVVTPRLVQGLLATLDQHGPAPSAGEPAPALVHWCLAPQTVAMSRIGADGHASRGDFLPPVPLPRRMWAGGSLEFHSPLLVGDLVERSSRISDVMTATATW